MNSLPALWLIKAEQLRSDFELAPEETRRVLSACAKAGTIRPTQTAAVMRETLDRAIRELAPVAKATEIGESERARRAALYDNYFGIVRADGGVETLARGFLCAFRGFVDGEGVSGPSALTEALFDGLTDLLQMCADLTGERP